MALLFDVYALSTAIQIVEFKTKRPFSLICSLRVSSASSSCLLSKIKPQQAHFAGFCATGFYEWLLQARTRDSKVHANMLL